MSDISPLRDCDLSDAYANGGLNLYLNIEYDTDLTPLSGIRAFSSLQLDGDKPEKWLPYLQNTTVGSLTLNNVHGEVAVDQLPPVTERLELHNVHSISDLAGLKGPGPRELQLDDLSQLKSLNGLQGLVGEGGIRLIQIGGCPKLADWSALEGADLERLQVYGDLVFLPDSRQDKAEPVFDGWWNNNVSLSVSSKEEIESLPEAARNRITSVGIVGDRIYDMSRYELDEEWDRKGPVLYVRNRDNGETEKAETGSGIDLSFLYSLPGLEQLTLAAQPLTDLEALRPLTGLKELDLSFCTKLTDLSAIAGMQSLEKLILDRCSGIKSLDGIGIMNRMRELNLNGTNITDLSILTQWDFRYAAENGGFNLSIDNRKIKDFSFMSGIGRFSWLGMGGIDPNKWIKYVSSAQIEGIFMGGVTQKGLNEFIENHPEIGNLHIQNSPKVTDLSMLQGLRNLWNLKISSNMKKARQTLDGWTWTFRLEVEGE